MKGRTAVERKSVAFKNHSAEDRDAGGNEIKFHSQLGSVSIQIN
jgi:hypothetical protein